MKKAFTLVELVLAVIIIGILFSIVSISLKEIRRSGRDTKRVSDISQVQLLLESYYRYEEKYPEELNFGESLIGEKTNKIYTLNLPQNPQPTNNDCLEKEYFYKKAEDGSYILKMCLEKEINEFESGLNCISIIEENCWECGDQITDDRDENTYQTVKIGDQCWLAENLKYLPLVHNNIEFESQGLNGLPGYGVLSYNGNDVSIAKTQTNYHEYGVLYNWYAANQEYLCPEGWHVSTNNEWINLINYLEENQGIKIKSSTIDTPSWNGSNESGFSAVKSAYRNTDGSFDVVHVFIAWTKDTNWTYILDDSSITVTAANYYSIRRGHSIRCLKD